MSDVRIAREVHLVGSVPLGSAEDVFRACSGALRERLRRYPDGETGFRKNWVNFQFLVLARHPELEFVGPAVDPEKLALESDGQGADYDFTLLRVRVGAKERGFRFGALGYAENARTSYATFAALKRENVIPAAARFQVSLPTPLAPVALYVTPESLLDVYGPYRDALCAELDEIVAAIPHRELAVQWDVAVEFALWEGLFPPPPGDWKGMLLGELAGLGARVPADVELGYHLCYGDRGHKHFVEPKDTANLVEVANGIAARLERSLDWLHLPVPRARDDQAYFAPLAGLTLPARTELFLGLVHHTDGIAGAARRIAAAERVVPRFGIATECGLGRRSPASIDDLLRLHATIS